MDYSFIVVVIENNVRCNDSYFTLYDIVLFKSKSHSFALGLCPKIGYNCADLSKNIMPSEDI